MAAAWHNDEHVKNECRNNNCKKQRIPFDIINYMSHQLAIITVVYENYTVLDDFFKSLKKQTNKNFHLFIVDLSKQRKPIVVDDLPVTVLTGENRGYAYGVNTGMCAALKKGSETFCVINDDTYFQSDFVNNVSDGISEHPFSLIGGKIYYASGYEYHQDRYGESDRGNVLWYAGGANDWKNVATNHRGVDEVDTAQYNQFEETGFVTGCLMCFDRKIVNKVGYWNESYFLYYEDADYCVRAQKKGARLYYDPSIVIWHKNAQSTGGSGSQLHKKYQRDNRLKFGMKYAPLRTKLHLLKNRIFDFSQKDNKEQ